MVNHTASTAPTVLVASPDSSVESEPQRTTRSRVSASKATPVVASSQAAGISALAADSQSESYDSQLQSQQVVLINDNQTAANGIEQRPKLRSGSRSNVLQSPVAAPGQRRSGRSAAPTLPAVPEVPQSPAPAAGNYLNNFYPLFADYCFVLWQLLRPQWAAPLRRTRSSARKCGNSSPDTACTMEW